MSCQGVALLLVTGNEYIAVLYQTLYSVADGGEIGSYAVVPFPYLMPPRERYLHTAVLDFS